MTDTMKIFGADHPSFPVVVRDVRPAHEFEIVTPGVLRIVGSTITITVRGTEFVVTYGASPGGLYATLAAAKRSAINLLNDLQQMGLEP